MRSPEQDGSPRIWLHFFHIYIVGGSGGSRKPSHVAFTLVMMFDFKNFSALQNMKLKPNTFFFLNGVFKAAFVTVASPLSRLQGLL